MEKAFQAIAGQKQKERGFRMAETTMREVRGGSASAGFHLAALG
jgi:hypothetical protein